MKKLNNRGYLLVEIIVAIVLALGIAYFLMSLTIKFSKTDEDIYQSITWINDKNILTNTIMEDVENYNLMSITKSGDSILFRYNDTDVGDNGVKELFIDRDNRTISYDDYKKSFDKSLTVGDPIIDINVEKKYSSIIIPMTSIYSDEDYGIKLFFPDTIKFLYDIIASSSVLDNTNSDFVTADSGIDFSKISSSTNGQGVYLLASSKNKDYPIYYYRGNIDNNNVIFANFCWKIVRTTETGGIKLIYNGSPTDKKCNGDNPIIGSSSFNLGLVSNSNPSSPILTGYMYDIDNWYREHIHYYLQINERTLIPDVNYSQKSFYYGSDVEYKDGKYILIDPIAISVSNGDEFKAINKSNSVLNQYHYTCLSESTECDTVYYITYVGYMGSVTPKSEAAITVTLSDGSNVTEALEKMLSNNNDESSTIKKELDEWYKDNINTNYSNYIEDTIWCNDRSIKLEESDVEKFKNFGAWYPAGGGVQSYLTFSTKYNISNKMSPNFSCSNEADRFTVSESNGNGNLDYPLGLLTADEIILAGGKFDSTNDNFYLDVNKIFWTMSPSLFRRFSYGFALDENGKFFDDHVSAKYGIRPSVSLVHDVVIEKGDGSANNPYVIK